mmetsp:Transcript_13891/g.36889  ORF Transcript_13891/g.36889 Transcript_13891/m.36889 type:complete len:222 (-) Transcript_13891:800-1465(-)
MADVSVARVGPRAPRELRVGRRGQERREGRLPAIVREREAAVRRGALEADTAAHERPREVEGRRVGREGRLELAVDGRRGIRGARPPCPQPAPEGENLTEFIDIAVHQGHASPVVGALEERQEAEAADNRREFDADARQRRERADRRAHSVVVRQRVVRREEGGRPLGRAAVPLKCRADGELEGIGPRVGEIFGVGGLGERSVVPGRQGLCRREVERLGSS